VRLSRASPARLIGSYPFRLDQNWLAAPPLETLDFALVRNFRLTEKLNFQLRGEAFNALNKVNLGTPNRFVNTPQFGTITTPMTPGREIQIGARFSF
jgi:hypothetical protein